MRRKIIFIAPFYHTYGAQPLCLVGVLYRGEIKQAVTLAQPTSCHTISLCSSTSFPMAEKREKIEKTYLERLRGSSLAYRESFLLLLGTMAESG
jgi:hypothetical protein